MREERPDLRESATLIVCEKIGLDVWFYHLVEMGVPKDSILVIDPRNRSGMERALEELGNFQDGKGATAEPGGHVGSRGRRARPPLRYYVVHWDVLAKLEALTRKRGAQGTGGPFIEFAHVIADEVHIAKNRKAQRTIYLKRIACLYKTGLSGTPADNKPQDLWSVLHWLYPRRFRSYWRFYNTYVKSEKHPMGYRIQTGVQNVDQLHREMSAFYIRRTLTEVVKDMPEKIHVSPVTRVKLEGKHRRQYEQMEQNAIAEIMALEERAREEGSYTLVAPAIIAVLTRLQQMALAPLSPEWDDDYDPEDPDSEPRVVLSRPSPKLDAIMNLIETHEEEPFVVFTQFRGMADLVEEACREKGIGVVKITGEVTSKDTRTDLVRRFQNGESESTGSGRQVRVFVGTIAAAGKTITLTRANIAIFADRSWNPSKNDQAEDRLWRRTQRNAVRIYDIVADDTIDAYRLAKIEEKGNWLFDFLNPKGSKNAQKFSSSSGIGSLIQSLGG